MHLLISVLAVVMSITLSQVAHSAPSPSECGISNPIRIVSVQTSSELARALSSALYGDLILLESGTYSGRFSVDRNGTSGNKITLCGSRAAVLDGGNSGSGYGIHLEADHWNLVGFTVRRSQKGIVLDGARQNHLHSLHVKDIGHEAVHFRSHSSNNLISDSLIQNTGLEDPGYGEGVYIGSANSNWCRYTGCNPDRSDNNRVIGNEFSTVRGEMIDLKEGTTNTVIDSNQFDGSGISGIHFADAFIDIKGNDVLVKNNRGINSGTKLRDGIQIFAPLSGSAVDIIILSNTFEVNGSGYGIRVDKDAVNVQVACNNQVTGADSGLSNISCVSLPDSGGGESSPPPTPSPEPSPDNSNLASLSKVIRHSAVRSDHPIKNLFDGCTSGTSACSIGHDQTNTFTVELDLGALYDLSEVIVYGDKDGTWVSTEFDLSIKKGANDSYRQIVNGANIFSNTPVTKDLNEQSARYVLITVFGDQSTTKFHVRELKIYGKPTTTSEEPPAEETDSGSLINIASTDSLVWMSELALDHPIANFFDGCTNNDKNCMIGYREDNNWTGVFTINDAVTLKELRVFGDAQGNWVSNKIDIEYKKGATASYQSLYTGANIRADKWFSFDLREIRATHIRVRIHGDSTTSTVQARELEIFVLRD